MDAPDDEFIPDPTWPVPEPLSAADAETLLAHLDDPPPPNEALRKLMSGDSAPASPHIVPGEGR